MHFELISDTLLETQTRPWASINQTELLSGLNEWADFFSVM